MTVLSNTDILKARLTDWRKLAQALHGRFDTAGLDAAIRFARVVASAAAEVGGDPEIRLTARWVEVMLATRRNDGWWVTDTDVDLARLITLLAIDEGVTPNPTAVMQAELALDTAALATLAPFWAALLTGDPGSVVDDTVLDPDFRVPNLWFQGTDQHPTPRQRFHIDLWLAHDVAEERIAAAVAAGGRVVDDREAPSFTVLADPDDNKACVCTCLGR